MMFKKFLCLSLALFMLLVTFASCQTDGNGDETSETKNNETEPDNEDELNLPEDLYFENETVVFLTRDAKEWTTYDIYSEGGGGDTISEAVFKRNELVRNRLGVTIQEMKVTDAELLQKVQQTVSTNLDDFQAVVSRSLEASSMAVSGYLRDLNSQTIDYLDLSQEWWDQNISNELSLGGHLYYSTGDIVTTDNDATFCILFNKTLAEDNKLPDFYQLVEDHEWTLSNMLDYMDIVGTDSGSDRTYGLLNTNDTAFSIYYGAGLKVIGKDTDTDSYTYMLDVKLADDIADKAKLIFSESLSLNLVDEQSKTGEELMALGQQYFGSGKALFYGDVLQCVERMRAFDVEFGVLPYPLYNTNQSDYHHMMHLEGTVVSIPRSGKIQGSVLEKVCATMEAMAYYAQDTVTKQYYDINLTSKYIDDPESAPMIDLILETRVYDLAYYFDLTPNQGNITHTLADCMRPNSNTSIASATKSMDRMLINKLNQIVIGMNNQSDRYGE